MHDLIIGVTIVTLAFFPRSLRSRMVASLCIDVDVDALEPLSLSGVCSFQCQSGRSLLFPLMYVIPELLDFINGK